MKTGLFEKVWWILMAIIVVTLFITSIQALLDGVLFGLIGLIGTAAFGAMLYQSKHFLATNHPKDKGGPE